MLFVATNVDRGTAATPNSLALPDGRSPFSRCPMVGLFAVLRSLATHWQLIFSDVRDVFCGEFKTGNAIDFQGDLFPVNDGLHIEEA